MDYKFEILERQNCFDGFFKLDRFRIKHDLFAGGQSNVLQRELIYRGHAVAIVLYDPVREKLVLIEQFRIGALNESHPWVMELVAGFQEENETIEDVVHREVLEEAGLKVNSVDVIGSYYSNPANSSDSITLVCACVDSEKAGGIHGLDHEGEDIKVHVLPLDEACAQMFNGRINSATPIIALQWLQIHKAQFKPA